jgi:hypothetical protein
MTHIGLAVQCYREGQVFHFDAAEEKVLAYARA